MFKIDYLANLIKPLSPAQLAGIWLTGDFRVTPDRASVTYVLVAVVVLAAVGGLVWAWSRRAWELPLYVVGVMVGCFAFYPFSTPWIEGKALATAAAALPVAALVCCAPLLARGRRVEGAVLAALVAGGVLWSNALQYHDAWLAPRSQLRELESIGNRFAGQGPSLMTEFHPYGVRHFLRKLDAEGASELRSRPIPLRTGQQLDKGAYADIDDFSLDAVLVYRTLVLRRSPVESRPPSPYRLVSQGRFYEVWQRPEVVDRPILEHLPLGTDLQPAAVPSCAEVLRLGEVAGRERASWRRSSGRRRSRCISHRPRILRAGGSVRRAIWYPRAPAPSRRRFRCPQQVATASGSEGRSATGSRSRWTAGRSPRRVTSSTTAASTRRWARSSSTPELMPSRSATAAPIFARGAAVSSSPWARSCSVARRPTCR